jgi:Zn-dependent protease
LKYRALERGPGLKRPGLHGAGRRNACHESLGVDDPKPDPTKPNPLAEYAHLLPPGYQQPKAFELKPRSEAKRNGGIASIGAVLLALALKFKAVLAFLLNFKFIAIGAKFFLLSGTLLLSIVLWAQIFGLSFATGFVLLILVHELGHYFAIRAYGMEAGLPVFVPFLGAFTTHKQPAPTPMASAVIALAGPLIGGVGAFACYVAGIQTGQPFWYALASTMFFINLFNLIPIAPLDGGHIVGALWSKNPPMPTAERVLIAIVSIGLAIALFALWHTAAHAVGPLSR